MRARRFAACAGFFRIAGFLVCAGFAFSVLLLALTIGRSTRVLPSVSFAARS